MTRLSPQFRLAPAPPFIPPEGGIKGGPSPDSIEIPAARGAEFPDKVLKLIVRADLLAVAPAPDVFAELPEKVLLLMVIRPAFGLM